MWITGGFFGEIALTSSQGARRAASVLSKTVATLQQLSREDLEEVALDEPSLLHIIRQTAMKRRRELGEEVRAVKDIAFGAFTSNVVAKRLLVKLKTKVGSSRARHQEANQPSAAKGLLTKALVAKRVGTPLAESKVTRRHSLDAPSKEKRGMFGMKRFGTCGRCFARTAAVGPNSQSQKQRVDHVSMTTGLSSSESNPPESQRSIDWNKRLSTNPAMAFALKVAADDACSDPDPDIHLAPKRVGCQSDVGPLAASPVEMPSRKCGANQGAQVSISAAGKLRRCCPTEGAETTVESIPSETHASMTEMVEEMRAMSTAVQAVAAAQNRLEQQMESKMNEMADKTSTLFRAISAIRVASVTSGKLKGGL